MSTTKRKMKKVFLNRTMSFLCTLCAFFVQPHTDVSAMEIQEMSRSSQKVLENEDILLSIFPYVQSNDSKDIYHFCAANKKLNKKWKDIKFLKKLLTHPEYLVDEKINSRRYLQCALMNENDILRLSNGISVEFIEKSKNKLYGHKHQLELTSSLTSLEILDILYKICKAKKMFSQNNMQVFPPNILWTEWCAKGIFLAYERPSPYPPHEIRWKFASVLWSDNKPNDFDCWDTQCEKWIQDLSSMRFEHPNAALMYAFFGRGYSATFWCKMPSRINSKVIVERMPVSPPFTFYSKEIKNCRKHHEELITCFAIAIKGGVKGAVEKYLWASNQPYTENLRGLDIAQLQQEYIDSLITNPNSQDQKK